MKVSVVKIGNSKGIRIPKAILHQFSIEDELEMEVHEREIVLKPIERPPRQGWREEFKRMHQRGDDIDAFPVVEEVDNFEWEWD